MLPAALQTTKSTKYKYFYPLLLFHLYLTLTGRRAYTAYIGTQQNTNMEIISKQYFAEI